MHQKPFPVIDMVETGKNIMRLREERGMTVRDLQAYFGFEEPQAIYKWQRGKSLPTVDNLYALGALLDVPMEDILVPANAKSNIIMLEQQEEPCCSNHFGPGFGFLPKKTPATHSIRPFARRHFSYLHVSGNQPRSEDGDVWLGVRMKDWQTGG